MEVAEFAVEVPIVQTPEEVPIIQTPVEVPILQTPVKVESRKHRVCPQSPSVSRFTRSRVAPDWTVQEMLILVNEFVAVNNDCLRQLPSYQKWKMISENMATLHIIRSSSQCQRKWESLLSDYRKIKNWESQSGTGSFWCMESEKKNVFGLPVILDRELFSLMDAFLMDNRSGLVSDVRGPKKEACSEALEDHARRYMAKKLQEDMQLIQVILSRELKESKGNGCPPDVKNPIDHKIEFTRQQADELIKVFETLVGTLNQYTELVKGSG